MDITKLSPASRGVLCAIAAVMIFGTSTPIAKVFLDQVQPLMLAGLLTVSAGISLTLYWFFNQALNASRKQPTFLRGKDWNWLLASTAFGGVIAPNLLMLGIANSPASSAALLLSSETLFTVLIAWGIFREKLDWRLVSGIAVILAGSLIITLGKYHSFQTSWGLIMVAASCFCWAMDNNFTHQIAHRDPLQIVTLKSSISGGINLSLALAIGQSLPHLSLLGVTAIFGILNYGICLLLFVFALRYIGASRTGAYFSLTPFIGAAIAVLGLKEPITPALMVAGLFMALGVWLCLPRQS